MGLWCGGECKERGDRLSAIAHGICTLSPACFSHPWPEENLKPSCEWGEAALRGKPLGSYTMNPILDGKASAPAPETCYHQGTDQVIIESFCVIGPLAFLS